MYDNQFAQNRAARRSAFAIFSAIGIALFATPSAWAEDPQYDDASVIRKISGRSEKLELTTNSSRILKLDKNIPRVQVNNPELVAVTPLSATDVQISAKKAGVTQVNLWDEDGNIHTIDVLIYGDARELTVALQTQFPHSSIRVYRYSESLVLTGFVDRPDHVGPIMRLAEDYAPKVINNISVGGVQQILLKVKVMEVNRSKLRQLGADWAHFSSSGVGSVSSVSGLISEVAQVTRGADTVTPNVEGGPGLVNNLGTFQFGIIKGGDTFFGFIDFLQQRRVAKTIAEPNLVAVSGRPAQFNVGGETPILIPQSLGTTSIEFKPFGTQIDFLPIVLGNGNIRLEVRPRISELDEAAGIQLQDIEVPGFKVRQVDTAAEMKAGQTFALAGLVQERTFTINRGVPYLADLPIIGVPFRRTLDEVDEIELLILVTPEFVDPIDAHEVPCGGPGYATVSPTNKQLYCGGHIEVPAHCNPITGMTACGEGSCGYCGPNGYNADCATSGDGGVYGEPAPLITDGVVLPGGTGYDDSTTITDQHMIELPSSQPMRDGPDDLPLPDEGSDADGRPSHGASFQPRPAGPGQFGRSPYTPSRRPVFMRNASRPQNPTPPPAQPAAQAGENGLFGPVGYDAQ